MWERITKEKKHAYAEASLSPHGGMMPGITYCWKQQIPPIRHTKKTECKIVRRRTYPSLPRIPMVDTPVVSVWGEIILEVTAPLVLVAAIRTVDKPISRAATTWRLPNNEFAEVSLPVKKHPIQPIQAERNGKARSTWESVRPTVYTMPIINKYKYNIDEVNFYKSCLKEIMFCQRKI